MKILWISDQSLFDNSNGFTISIREILNQLSLNGVDVKIITASIFNTFDGISQKKIFDDLFKNHTGKIVKVVDNNLMHDVLITKKIFRSLLFEAEGISLYNHYCKVLEEYKPDYVFSAKNGLLEQAIFREAKFQNIKTLAYLVNPVYSGSRWLRDIDYLLTDTDATSNFYKEKEGYDLIKIGRFITKERYLVNKKNPQNILFINPIFSKGVIFVIQLAILFEKKYPDIQFEIIDSNGTWDKIYNKALINFNLSQKLSNITVTKNTKNMSEVYSRAKLLLLPSMYFDSGPRVIVEAQLNSIPVVGSNYGGIPECIGEGGILIDFNKEYYEEPYKRIIDNKTVIETANKIAKFYNDLAYYEEMSSKALENFNLNHNLETNGKQLVKFLHDKLLINN